VDSRHCSLGVVWAFVFGACSESGNDAIAAGSTAAATKDGTVHSAASVTQSGPSADATSSASVVGSAASGASESVPCAPQHPLIPAANDTTFEAQVVFASQGSPLVLGASTVAEGGQHYTIGQLKLFLSEFALERKDGVRVEVAPVDAKGEALPFAMVLLDAEEAPAFLRLRAPLGDYVALQARVGIPKACNALDPTRNVYPLNADSDMYWTWGGKFVFVKVEGFAIDSASDTKSSLVLHTGNLLAEDPTTDCTVRIPVNAALTGGKLRINVDELATPPTAAEGVAHGPAPWLYERIRAGKVFSFVP
jgi:hypothetical protein